MVEVAPRESILGSGAGGPLTAPSPWTQFPGYLTWSGGIVLGNASGGNKGAGTVNCTGLFKNGVAVDPLNFVAVAGGTMTGLLLLSDNPTATFGAATKGYVDTSISTVNTSLGSYLLKTGGTLTGPLILAADPTSALGAATKQYVDSKTGPVITIPDAPSDGSTYGRNNAAWTNVIDAGTY